MAIFEIKGLIEFLNSQTEHIKKFTSLHVGFFEGVDGVSFYVTGSPKSSESADGHCHFEAFPLSESRYYETNHKTDDPFVFADDIKKLLSDALVEKKLSVVFSDAEVITAGWDDGDLIRLR